MATITRTDERLIVDISAPGYAKENVSVKAKVSEDKKFTLVVNVSPAKTDKKFGIYANLPGFKEKIDINDEVFDLEHTTAEVENGIIRVCVPKKPDYVSKTIVDFGAPADPAPAQE